jgi:SAM-dependent methyltransferase
MSHDALGLALRDTLQGRIKEPLWLNTSYGDPEIMPVDVFFRQEKDLTALERYALTFVRGKVLDGGAGAGAHSLILQEKGHEVVALELSEMACDVMRQRHVRRVVQGDLFQYAEEKFDTIWLMMNGIGYVGRLSKLLQALRHLHTLLGINGRIILDSSDIRYLYDNDIPQDRYFGEIDYQYVYKGDAGEWFSWLFVDQRMLAHYASLAGFTCQIVYEDKEDQYLAILTPKAHERENF